MSMSSYEPDREYGDENAYEAYRDRLATGLCSRCRENESLPDDEWCRDCALEVEVALAEVEHAA